jgi:hypothetical protein
VAFSPNPFIWQYHCCSCWSASTTYRKW